MTFERTVLIAFFALSSGVTAQSREVCVVESSAEVCPEAVAPDAPLARRPEGLRSLEPDFLEPF